VFRLPLSAVNPRTKTAAACRLWTKKISPDVGLRYGIGGPRQLNAAKSLSMSLWVKRAVLAVRRSLPVYLQRTSTRERVRLMPNLEIAASFDNRIGAAERRPFTVS
jgi:hypothetical protein